jgi:flagellar FliJ protein
VSTRRDRDRGLKAVARVREVRDRDSLIGLRQAGAEHAARQLDAERVQEKIREHTSTAAGGEQEMSQFTAQRHVLLALGAAAHRAEQEVETAAHLKAAAQEHWQRDRARLRAVEHLLKLRAEAWDAEAARSVARELDDIGGRLWLRGRSGSR